MKKRTRKAIVYSAVYLIITWVITLVIEQLPGFHSGDWISLWLISSIPVAIYWAKRFINAGDD